MNFLKTSNTNKAAGLQKYSAALFLSAAFLILIVLPLFQKGTFIDGELYKTVAFNAAIHSSSFWNMKYTMTCMPYFCEQPPLYPYLLGNFYQWFGSSYLVDRCFTLLLLIVFIFLIREIIKQIFASTRFYYPLFLLLMISIPVWCWSYVNQVIEPLVCVFTALGILSFIRYLSSKKVIHILIFAASFYSSFLTKGFQSCFIIVLPLVYFLISRFSKAAFYFILVSGFITALSLIITLKFYKPAIVWFDCYYNARLVLTLQNVGHTTDSHVEIIVRFFTELLVPFIILSGLFVWLKIKRKYPLKFIFKDFLSDKLAVAFLITALAGSFPYAISLVQRGFYLVPSFVCFLLSIIVGFKRYWVFFYVSVRKINGYKITSPLVSLIFVGTIIYCCFFISAYKRDENLLTDIEKITLYISAKDTVLIEDNTWNYFNLHSYLYRMKQIDLTTTDHSRRFLIRDHSSSQAVDSSYKKIKLETKHLDLYIKQPNPSDK